MQRGLALAKPGYIVLLALDGHQRGVADRGEVDQPAAMEHLALRQLVLDEHLIDGLQVIFGGEVHHGEIFVVEFLVLLDRIAIAARRD